MTERKVELPLELLQEVLEEDEESCPLDLSLCSQGLERRSLKERWSGWARMVDC